MSSIDNALDASVNGKSAVIEPVLPGGTGGSGNSAQTGASDDPLTGTVLVGGAPPQEPAATATDSSKAAGATAKSAPDDGIGATLLASGALVLGGATALTVITYLAPAKSLTEGCASISGACDASKLLAGWGGYIALLVGVLAAGVIAALIVVGRPRGIRNIATADRMNPFQYGELSERLAGINVRYQNLCLPSPNAGGFTSLSGQIACEEVREHRDYVASELGLGTGADRRTVRKRMGAKWVTGSGFLEIWTRLHSAESSLIIVSPKEEVIASALFDEARLTGSNIMAADTLLRKLRAAVAVLGGKRYLSTDAAAVLGDLDEDADIQRQTQARLILSDVRDAINEFRDAGRTGLVRTKSQLIWTGFLTGVVAYGMLALAILVGAERRQIVAAVAFFLMGAVVGLFAQLRNSTSADSGGSEDDFGLARARLIYSPLLSGLAAVGGVLVTAMIYASLTGVIPVAATTTDGNATPTPNIVAATSATGSGSAQDQNPTPKLDAIFDLGDGRFGLLVAAIFGLTPELLINRLQDQADKYKTDLQSTGVQTRAA